MNEENRNRRILVGGGMSGLTLAAAAAQIAAMDIGEVLHERRIPSMPPFGLFEPTLREPRIRDWEDRAKPRPNRKKAKQRAQKQARRRNRRRGR